MLLEFRTRSKEEKLEEPIARIVEREGEESPQDLKEKRLGQTARRHGRISEGFPNSEIEQLDDSYLWLFLFI